MRNATHLTTTAARWRAGGIDQRRSASNVGGAETAETESNTISVVTLPFCSFISCPLGSCLAATYECRELQFFKSRLWWDGGCSRYMREPRRSDHGFDAKHDMPTHGLGEALYGAHGWRALAAFQACYHALGSSHALRDFALRQTCTCAGGNQFAGNGEFVSQGVKGGAGFGVVQQFAR